jgi:topoisomerase IV subunit B
MADKPSPVYDESKIKTLSSLEHIRLRTGMYIGRIGTGAHPDDGCYVLLKEVVDNAIDEYIMGHGKEVEIKIDGNRVAVRDFGRGIPLGKVVDCVSKINTGAKYIPLLGVFMLSRMFRARIGARALACFTFR